MLYHAMLKTKSAMSSVAYNSALPLSSLSTVLAGEFARACFAYILMAGNARPVINGWEATRWQFACLAMDKSLLRTNTKALAEISAEHSLVVWRDVTGLHEALFVSGAGDKAGIELSIASDDAYFASRMRLFLPQMRIEAGFRAHALGLTEKAQTLAQNARTLIDQTDGDGFGWNGLATCYPSA